MNKLTIIGNLTRDPVLRATQNGKEVCDFTVAVNRRNQQNEADFFRVTAWEGLGKNCSKFLSKGRKVAVIGSVSLNTYTGSDGKMKASLEVLASDVEFLSSKNEQPQEQPKSVDKESGLETVEPNDLPF